MDFWDILVTGWIVYKSTLTAVRTRDSKLLLGESNNAANGAFTGTILAGVLAIFILYMAGLYE